MDIGNVIPLQKMCYSTKILYALHFTEFMKASKYPLYGCVNTDL